MVSWLHCERGQELVEYALIVSLLCLVIFSIAQSALVILSYNTIDDAARQGARLGVIGDNADRPDDIRAAVWEVTDVAGLDRANLTVDPIKQGNTIQVTVTYDMPLVIQIFSSPRITLRAVSTKVIELE
jgi:Flp pilus assembly protein TadG